MIDNLGTQIRKIRTERNLTQREIAKELKIQERAYQRYEYNQTEPKIKVMIRLADIYNISLDYLTGRNDDKTPFYRDING